VFLFNAASDRIESRSFSVQTFASLTESLCFAPARTASTRCCAETTDGIVSPAMASIVLRGAKNPQSQGG
jgi:hypothetical protein